jgi:hypothetical protein
MSTKPSPDEQSTINHHTPDSPKFGVLHRVPVLLCLRKGQYLSCYRCLRRGKNAQALEPARMYVLYSTIIMGTYTDRVESPPKALIGAVDTGRVACYSFR